MNGFESKRAWLVPMNLQLFAEEVQGSTEGSAEDGEAPATQPVMITLEEHNRLLQSEVDRRVTAATSKAKRDYEKKLSLSGLGDHERAMAEKDQEITDLREKLAAAARVQARSDLMQELGKRDLPMEFADMIVIDEDQAKNLENIGKLDKSFKAAVEAAVNRRLAGKTPPKGESHAAAMTKDEIMAIRDATERQAAIRDHIELFR